MSSTYRDRPQNAHPDQLIQARKAVATATARRVRTAIQALQAQQVAREMITVPRVAAAAGVPASTIYRRDDLFALVQKANPAVQRRRREAAYHREVTALRQQVAHLEQDLQFARRQHHLWQAGQGPGRSQDAVGRLRKEVTDLKRQLALRDQACVCGATDRLRPQLVPPGGETEAWRP